MAVADRLDLTLRLVRNAERISLNELADRLGVSLMTVRRDLDELQAKGLVQRVRGGAVALAAPAEEAGFALSLIHKRQSQARRSCSTPGRPQRPSRAASSRAHR